MYLFTLQPFYLFIYLPNLSFSLSHCKLVGGIWMGEKNPGGNNKYEEEELANTPSALSRLSRLSGLVRRPMKKHNRYINKSIGK